jgi:serine/threonine protein kinase
MSPCPSSDQLQRLLAEELDDAQRDPLESHIEGCAACQGALEELSRALVHEGEHTQGGDRSGSRHEPGSAFLRWLKREVPDTAAGDEEHHTKEMASTLTGAPARELAGTWPEVPGYEILDVLGKGGMGIVYRARQVSLDRIVALKMIRAEEHDDPERKARFRGEAAAVARLRHPNIVQVYEVGEQAGRPYFSLEFIGGGSLAEKLAGTPLPPRRAAEMIATLARAMHVAHQRGIVHRDLKPSNILLEQREITSSGNQPAEETPRELVVHRGSSSGDGWSHAVLKITDFGLAKQLDVNDLPTRSGVVMGTPSYMAPEQAGGRSKIVGPAIDIYALGAILYELLTGRPPFKAETAVETVLQVLSDEPLPPRRLQPKVPRDLEIICLKCLQKEPRKRYASAEALAEDLGRFLQKKPIHARPVSLWEHGWKWARRQPGWAALGVVSCLAAMSLVLGGLWYAAQLRAAVEESTRNARSAEERRQEALANARKARDAVDHMLTEVAEKHLVQIPQTETMRLALLNKALEFYQDFAREPEAGWDIRLEKARAFHRVGDIYRYLERYPDAETAYRQAIESFLLLKGERPQDVDVEQHLARSYNNLGIVYRAMRRREESETAHRTALDIRNQLDRDHPEEIRHQADLAQSYHNLADLCRSARRFDEAESYYGKDLAIHEKLIAASPEDPDHRYELARVHASLSALYRDRDRPEEIERVLGKAINILEGLLQEHRSTAKYQYLMSSCQMGLGNVCLDRWRKDRDKLARSRWAEQTEACYRKSITAAEPLVQEHPFNPDYQMQLMMSSYNLGLFYRESRRGKEAEPLYEKVLLAHKVLALEYPDKTSYAAGLGISYSNLGNCVTANGRPEAALALYAEGARGLEQALAKNKDHAYLQKCLRDALSGWAEALTKLGRHDEALRRWDRALELADSRSRDNLCLARACTLARRGDHRGAIAETKTVAEEKPSFRILYGKACVYSLASRAVRGDGKLNSEERERLADQYATQAMALLVEADRAGFLKSDDRRQHVQKDTDLDPIREREEFKRLLADWEARASGGRTPGPPPGKKQP